MNPLRRFIDENLLQRPELAGCRGDLAVVLAGSRAVGYPMPASDYDFLGLCDAPTYARLLRHLGHDPESQNLFAVLNTMTSKIGAYCRMCCLLDGKPFPYEKWLLRACADTRLGKCLVPIFERMLATLSNLQNDLPGGWPRVREAIDAIDTEACDALEDALVAWGIPKTWLDRSYHDRHMVLFQPLPVKPVGS